jgi:3-dehydroquinate dehydratase II
MNGQPRILVLHGPNLNMLGVREPEIYGTASLKDVEDLCRKTAESCGLAADCRQSNDEGELVTWIQESRGAYQGIVLNAGAYTHTSIALLDALKIAELPVMEVHITNIFAREPFRHQSYVSQAAIGVISGLGVAGYAYAMQSLAEHILRNRKKHDFF